MRDDVDTFSPVSFAPKDTGNPAVTREKPHQHPQYVPATPMQAPVLKGLSPSSFPSISAIRSHMVEVIRNHAVSFIRLEMARRVHSVLDTKSDAENIVPDIECLSETGKLESVIIGFPDNMMLGGHREIINATQEKNLSNGLMPTPSETVAEFIELKHVLEANGVNVLMPNYVDVQEQIYTRDIGFVIGKTFFVSGMAKAARKPEVAGIQHTIAGFPPENVIHIPDGMTIEGGDVIVDRGVVYIGVGQRTEGKAVDFMRDALKDSGLKVEPIYIKQPHEGEDSLHLDCTFMPVGEGYALIYPDAMRNIPQSIRNNYNWIIVTREEQENLGTNVLSLSPTKVLSRDSSVRLNEAMKKVGIEVIELKFDQAPINGGSFRCCSLPLKRSNF